MNEEMLKSWKRWTDPMLSEQHREKVPVDSLYFKAFQAGWDSAVDAQVARMAYEIESLEQQLRDERKRDGKAT